MATTGYIFEYDPIVGGNQKNCDLYTRSLNYTGSKCSEPGTYVPIHPPHKLAKNTSESAFQYRKRVLAIDTLTFSDCAYPIISLRGVDQYQFEVYGFLPNFGFSEHFELEYTQEKGYGFNLTFLVVPNIQSVPNHPIQNKIILPGIVITNPQDDAYNNQYIYGDLIESNYGVTTYIEGDTVVGVTEYDEYYTKKDVEVVKFQAQDPVYNTDAKFVLHSFTGPTPKTAGSGVNTDFISQDSKISCFEIEGTHKTFCGNEARLRAFNECESNDCSVISTSDGLEYRVVDTVSDRVLKNTVVQNAKTQCAFIPSQDIHSDGFKPKFTDPIQLVTLNGKQYNTKAGANAYEVAKAECLIDKNCDGIHSEPNSASLVKESNGFVTTASEPNSASLVKESNGSVTTTSGVIPAPGGVYLSIKY
jgi:hypothetical protein